MSNVLTVSKDTPARGGSIAVGRPARRGYRILRWGFVALPLLAGLDKLAGVLIDWDAYVAPALIPLLPVGTRAFVAIVGAGEVALACLAMVKPRTSAHVLAGWLGVMAVNLVVGGFFGVACGVLGLCVAATAFGWMRAGSTRPSRPSREMLQFPFRPQPEGVVASSRDIEGASDRTSSPDSTPPPDSTRFAPGGVAHVARATAHSN